MTRSSSSDSIERTLFSKPQLLITESAEVFAALNTTLMEEIQPRDIIERLYVEDFAVLVWETLRLRRCKTAIVNIAFKDALSHIVYRLAGEPQVGSPEREWYEAIVVDWFSKPKARKEVLQLLSTSSAAIAKRLDVLARKIAGNSKNEIILEHARAAAQAELDLAGVRQVKVALIERVSALGSLDAPQDFGSVAQGIRYLKSVLSGRSPPALPQRIDPSATMPTEEPGRTAEAVRRAFPELAKLDRYESRAVARRDRAIRQIVKKD